jgi:hypothetical protein
VAAVVVVTAFLAMILVPVQSASKEIQVSPRSSATADLSIPRAGWVTVHFDHVGGSAGMMAGSGMTYWMDGPSGMMFNHSMMRADDSYSFWTWGGTYRCGAGYAGLGPGMMDVWVNASWGML